MTEAIVLASMQAQIDALVRQVARHESKIAELSVVNRDKTDRLTLAKNFALHAQRVSAITEDMCGGHELEAIASRAKDLIDGARFCYDQVQARVDAAARALVAASFDTSDEP